MHATFCRDHDQLHGSAGYWNTEAAYPKRPWLAGTGIVLNARIVGTPDYVVEIARKLWGSGMKLIVVSYCETPGEQAEVYKRVHDMCGC